MLMDKGSLRLYAVTDAGCIGERDFLETIEAALAGGVTMLQLREKNMDGVALLERAQDVREVCDRYGVPLIVDDDWRTAFAAGAAGVHLGAEDTPPEIVRHFTNERFLIGVTAKTVAQAKRAEAAGADYLGVGAVFPSPTKPDAIRITPDLLREIAASVSIPVVAIGGITADNIHTLNGCGATGAAVVSAVFGQKDVTAAARQLRALAEEMAKSR